MNHSHLKQSIERHTGRESISTHQAIAKQATSHSASLSGIGKPKNNRGNQLLESILIGLYCLVLICIYITPKANGSSLEQSPVGARDRENRSYSLSVVRVHENA